jgi:hypothetical protein
VPQAARGFSSAAIQGRAGRDVERRAQFLNSGRGEVGAPGRDDVVLRSAGVGNCIACLGHPKPVQPAGLDLIGFAAALGALLVDGLLTIVLAATRWYWTTLGV